ncbi:hypothetical protein RD792_007049 [Penstemon davidsonii]|uniref:SBP-type domain-containing protein n=1 Tax=Penstemon davidsonii TaxID=160366 RepID=A0ABR0D6N2_9LAMI|nr:hypothetical protein RD792_007049 [Penstemon davidsonii]
MEAVVLNNKPMKDKMKGVDSVTELSEDDELMRTEDDKKKRAASGGASMKKNSSGGGVSSMKSCQAEKCSTDLSDAKPYHRRHKVCEHHAKAQVVLVAGIRQRFCQQCSRFHEVSEFDEAKRSCRRRLAGHNERRRKNPPDNSQAADGSTTTTTGRVKGIQITVQENANNYKHFHVR